MRILIIGGYGVFGGRIAELLKHEPRLTLLIAGRSVEKARALIAGQVNSHAALKPALFDRDGDIGAQLAFFRPTLVVDASGPFQVYGENPYRVVEACIAHGIDYLDLADGSDFVTSIAAFDEKARAAGVFALSGVSTCPALTAAAVRRLSRGMTSISSITGAIAPSPFARVGENVVRSIASYAGRPLRTHQGAERTAHPFTEQRRFTIAPPGCVPLNSRMFSLVDVPDLHTLPQSWPGTKDVWFGAGPVPEILQRMLVALAWLVRWRLLESLLPFAGLMHVALGRLSWGEHRGGMFVEVRGQGEAGSALTRSWHLLAEGDDGPFIPSMAVAAVVRNMLDNRRPRPGARACVDDLELEDYEALFASRKIQAGVRDDSAPTGPLYASLLDSAWNELPAPVRAMHELDDTLMAEGQVTVGQSTGALAKFAARIIGFPPPAENANITVRFDAEQGKQTWTRTIGAHHFKSVQFEGRGRSARLLCERFGPLTFAMAVVGKSSRLSLILRRWSLFGIALPLWLGPRINAYESVAGGRFEFHVDISHPFTGRIVKYEGWLTRRNAQAAAA